MESLKNRARAALPEELSCRSDASNVWNVKSGKNNLWTGSKATLCPNI